MKVKEYDRFFGEKISRELSMSWDNDGLMCCPDPEREVRRVLAVLDITEEAVDEAIRGGYDLILSHHPLVFRGIKSLTDRDGVGRKLLKLVQNGISAMSFHTRLDALTGGVNDLLAASLGLAEVTPFGTEQIGRIGTLPSAVSSEEFAHMVKATLNAPTVLLSSAGKRVSRVAVLGGSGRDDLFAAIAAGADTFLSGELGYHAMVDAPENGVNLVEAGHFYTEYPICKWLCDAARELDPAVECEVFFTDRMQVI